MGIAERKEREKLQRRRDILEAARSVFSEKGFQTATMDEIAERVELSKPTIYLYFDSKEDLYTSIALEDSYKVMERLKETVASDAGLVEKWQSVWLAFIEHCIENPEYVYISQHILAQESRQRVSDHILEEFDNHTRELVEQVSQLVEESIEKGLARDDLPPRTIVLITWRLTIGLLELHLSGRETEFGVDDYHKFFENSFDVLINGLLQRGS
ncbi:MAG: TetR/AcrR family transcriptional regulator [Actinobacteria bacterium]|nr:TetR/AcrR family transcriptional regulator [Actinomycetota bacterium]